MELLKSHEGTKFPLSQVLRERALAFLRTRTVDSGLIGYDDLTAAVGMDTQADTRARHAVLAAAKILLREDNRKLVNVRMAGYRIVPASAHVGGSQAEQKRARRWLRRSLDTVTHVALGELSAVDVAKVLQEQARVAITLSVTKKLARQKTLPEREQIALPSGAKLAEMFKRKTG